MVVVGIDEDEAVLTCPQEVVEFALGLDDTLEGTETLQVGFTHIGDQTAGGLCRLCQGLDVPRMTGAHLDDGNLMILRQAEQGLGHTDIIVEVALCIEHIIFLGEHGSHKLLGGCLTVGTGNADDGDIELATMFTGQILEGLQTVIDKDEPVVIGRLHGWIVDDGIGTTLLKG